MNNHLRMKQWQAIDTPLEALRVLAANSEYLSHDPYYQEQNSALWAMVNRILAKSDPHEPIECGCTPVEWLTLAMVMFSVTRNVSLAEFDDVFVRRAVSIWCAATDIEQERYGRLARKMLDHFEIVYRPSNIQHPTVTKDELVSFMLGPKQTVGSQAYETFFTKAFGTMSEALALVFHIMHKPSDVAARPVIEPVTPAPDEKPIRLIKNHAAVLQHIFEEYDLESASIMGSIAIRLNMEERIVRLACRALARKGLVVRKPLFTDEGQLCGSTYLLTQSGFEYGKKQGWPVP